MPPTIRRPSWAPLVLLLVALFSTVGIYQTRPALQNLTAAKLFEATAKIASTVSENAGRQRRDETSEEELARLTEQEHVRRPVAEPDETTPEQQQQQQQETRSKDHGPLNVVLFYADDWSFETLGAMGNNYVQTPVLDQLAKEGVLFTHNCVTTSICMQSRATLYTGQYSSRHQTLYAWRNVTMYEPERWKNTLYPLMVKAGYSTYCQTSSCQFDLAFNLINPFSSRRRRFLWKVSPP